MSLKIRLICLTNATSNDLLRRVLESAIEPHLSHLIKTKDVHNGVLSKNNDRTKKVDTTTRFTQLISKSHGAFLPRCETATRSSNRFSLRTMGDFESEEYTCNEINSS